MAKGDETVNCPDQRPGVRCPECGLKYVCGKWEEKAAAREKAKQEADAPLTSTLRPEGKP